MIFDFTLSIINKCAQTDKPNELVDKYLKFPMMKISALRNLLEIDPGVFRTPNSPFTHPKKNVNRRCTNIINKRE